MTRTSNSGINLIDLSKGVPSSVRLHLADSIILTFDHKILLQYRPESHDAPQGCINAFGGHVEANETPMQGLIRELKEELGAGMRADDITFIGAVTEEHTRHMELVHVHFWHDRWNAISGCFEGEAMHYRTLAAALAEIKLMEYTRWALEECARRGLIK